MPDREKVIKEFEHLLNDARGNYQDFVDLTVDGGDEILALLKEKEAAKPEWSCGRAYCGECGKRLPLKRWKHKPFCPSCGKGVNWDA